MMKKPLARTRIARGFYFFGIVAGNSLNENLNSDKKERYYANNLYVVYFNSLSFKT